MLDARDWDEMVIADNSYQHKSFTTPKILIPEHRRVFQRVRARYVTSYGRFAIFEIMQQTFRIDVSLQKVVFLAVT